MCFKVIMINVEHMKIRPQIRKLYLVKLLTTLSSCLLNSYYTRPKVSPISYEKPESDPLGFVIVKVGPLVAGPGPGPSWPLADIRDIAIIVIKILIYIPEYHTIYNIIMAEGGVIFGPDTFSARFRVRNILNLEGKKAEFRYLHVLIILAGGLRL